MIEPSASNAPVIVPSDDDCCSIKTSNFFIENMNTEISMGIIAPDLITCDPFPSVLAPENLENGCCEFSQQMPDDGIWLESNDTTYKTSVNSVATKKCVRFKPDAVNKHLL